MSKTLKAPAAKQADATVTLPTSNLGVSKIFSKEEVMAEIESIGKDSKGLGQRIQNTAIQTMLHGFTHGDFTLMTALYQNLDSSQRKEALKRFFVDLAPVEYKVTDPKKNVAQFVKAEGRDEWDFETAVKKPYYEYTPEKVQMPFDFEAIIKILQKNILDKVDSAKEKGKAIDERTEALANAIRGIVEHKDDLVQVANDDTTTTTEAVAEAA